MANTSNNNHRQLTIVMYPWFAMGHLTPYLVTANQFAQRGHKIIFIVPPKAQSRLAPLNLHPGLIQLRPISIPHFQGLPEHVETTNDVTIQDQHLLRRALNLTQPEIESLLCDLKPEAVLTKDQFDELLLGFEMTNFPFLIALRPPEGFDTLEEAMPKGFKERTKERGIVRSGWVPQNLILKHPSVGSFVTHCGYGSMWEGLMSHCRLVVLPNVVDQYIHARLLSAYLRVAVEVEKGDEDGLFTKDGVCEAIEAAMADQTGIGKEVKENHDKWYKLLLSEGFQDACFNNFVDNLCTLIE